MRVPSGFPGERLTVVPRPLVAAALARDVTRHLTVTDAGWFPRASGHYISRPRGVQEEIIIACVEGLGWASVRGSQFAVPAGTVLVLPSQEGHGYRADDADPWTIGWCHVRGSAAAELRRAAADRPVVQLRQPDRIYLLMEEVVSRLERDHGPASAMAASGAAWRMLTQIAADRRLPAREDPLHVAMDLIAERLDADTAVPDIARTVGLSASHLTALFHRATGGGIAAYRTSLRMARARTLLDRTDMTITEVAAEAGYTDPLYFSRLFRRRHGMSPTEYREVTKG